MATAIYNKHVVIDAATAAQKTFADEWVAAEIEFKEGEIKRLMKSGGLLGTSLSRRDAEQAFDSSHWRTWSILPSILYFQESILRLRSRSSHVDRLKKLAETTRDETVTLSDDDVALLFP